MTPNCIQLHNDQLQTTRFLLVIAIVCDQIIFLKVATKFSMTLSSSHLKSFSTNGQKTPYNQTFETLTPPFSSMISSILCNKKCDNYNPSPNITYAIMVHPFFSYPHPHLQSNTKPLFMIGSSHNSEHYIIRSWVPP